MICGDPNLPQSHHSTLFLINHLINHQSNGPAVYPNNYGHDLLFIVFYHDLVLVDFIHILQSYSTIDFSNASQEILKYNV